MARAATSDELTKLRSPGQWSELYLAIEAPAAVFAARVNQSFDTTDSITEVIFDGVTTGAYTDILPGMTAWIGSGAGLDDLGQCRIRKAATSSILYLGETSEIAWTDNLYITVVNEFGLWAKHLTIDGNLPRMDYDIEYSDQHTNLDPVPVLGPDVVAWLTGATVAITPTASGSWVLGSTITSYSWAAPGASATASLTTATPTLTYNAAGQYRIACTVTAANGKTFTGYRKVFIYSAASMPLVPVLENCAGDWESGGWSFSVTLYESAGLTTIRDRAKCILFSRDYYAGVDGSIGPVPGSENVIACGWLDGSPESLEYNSEAGSVKFSVRGPAYWLSKIPGYPAGVKDTADTPTTWLLYDGLTVAAGLWHFLHWRSTATAIMDITLMPDADLIPATEAPAGSLWQQLEAMAYQTILAKPVCDRYGRLFIQVDTQFTPLADRSTIPTVQAIAANDWRHEDGIQIDRRTTSEVSLLEVSGVNYDGTASAPMISRAPGNVYKRFGRIEAFDRLLFADQAAANNLAGLMLAQMNNPYPSVVIPLAANNRLVDIAPAQYVTLSVAAADTPRGITWTNQKLIPRRVSFNHDTESGALLTDLDCEAETTGTGQPAGVTVVPPQPPANNFPPTTPSTPDFPVIPPPNTWFPPVIGVNPHGDCKDDIGAPYNVQGVVFSPTIIYAGDTAYCFYPCGIRLAAATYGTSLRIYGIGYDDAIANCSIVAIDSAKNTILSPTSLLAVQNGVTAIFDPLAGVSVAGFAITIAAGGGYTDWVPGGVLATGTLNANDSGGAGLTVTPGGLYAIESTGGPYSLGVGWPNVQRSIDVAQNGTFGMTLGNSYFGETSSEAVMANEGWGSFAETAGIYGRGYFVAGGSATYTVRAYDGGGFPGHGDNTGTIGYALRSATATRSRRLQISSAILYNICAP
jgi:hypothetical protein